MVSVAITRRRRAFTLVELLVVIAIIGVLVALLLPAVQAAREAARRAQCLSRMRQLALGCQMHIDAFGYLPSGGWGYAWTGDPDRGFGADQPGAWLYNVLPYVEQQPLRDLGADADPGRHTATQLEGGRQRIETAWTLIACPSRRTATLHAIRPTVAALFRNADAPAGAARSDYAANAGTQDNESGRGPVTLDDAENFIWEATTRPARFDGVSFQRSQIGVEQVTDGLSKTLLLAEKAHVVSADADGSFGGDNEAWCTGFNNDLYRLVAGDPTIVEQVGAASPDPNRYLPPLSDARAEVVYAAWNADELRAQIGVRWGSAHAGGFNAAMCDGAVRTHRFDTDPQVLIGSATRAAESR